MVGKQGQWAGRLVGKQVQWAGRLVGKQVQWVGRVELLAGHLALHPLDPCTEVVYQGLFPQ